MSSLIKSHSCAERCSNVKQERRSSSCSKHYLSFRPSRLPEGRQIHYASPYTKRLSLRTSLSSVNPGRSYCQTPAHGLFKFSSDLFRNLILPDLHHLLPESPYP